MVPLEGIPELHEGDDLGQELYEAARRIGGLEAGDVVVVAQKAVSKVEGRVVRLAEVEASERARELAGPDGDPQHLEVRFEVVTTPRSGTGVWRHGKPIDMDITFTSAD